MVDVILVDRHTKRALSSFNIAGELLRIQLSGKKANFKPRFEDLETAVGREFQPLVKDFYRIALAVYISDLNFKRMAKVPNRTIRILISVSNRKLWVHHKQSLETVLYQLSGDNFVFHFVQGKQTRHQFEVAGEVDPDHVVSLFSGGLDSLAGISWLTERGLKPILVSHSSQTKVTNLQHSLATRLESLLGDVLEFHQINATRRRGKLKPNEGSQRLRSFLYLTLGCVFALQKGISKLFIFENGILALNIPISNSRMFLNTRTAHPAFLNMYEDLVSRIFNAKLDVINPFLEKTKSEIVSLLDRRGFRSLIKNTISCSRFTALIMDRRHIPISEIWHCGICLPCILRRIAMYAAGLSTFDVKYADDVLKDFSSLAPEGKRVILELLEFCRKLKECKGKDDILTAFPSFFVEGIDPEPLIDLYLRYVEEVRGFFRRFPTLRHVLS